MRQIIQVHPLSHIPQTFHMPKENLCQLTLQGLEFIHGQNIVHLDIKPYNILFSRSVHPKYIIQAQHLQSFLQCQCRFWAENHWLWSGSEAWRWRSHWCQRTAGTYPHLHCHHHCHCHHHNCNFHHHYLQFVIQFIYICDILYAVHIVNSGHSGVYCSWTHLLQDSFNLLRYVVRLAIYKYPAIYQYIHLYIFIYHYVCGHTDWLNIIIIKLFWIVYHH